jgi:hypothetical protein
MSLLHSLFKKMISYILHLVTFSVSFIVYNYNYLLALSLFLTISIDFWLFVFFNIESFFSFIHYIHLPPPPSPTGPNILSLCCFLSLHPWNYLPLPLFFLSPSYSVSISVSVIICLSVCLCPSFFKFSMALKLIIFSAMFSTQHICLYFPRIKIWN